MEGHRDNDRGPLACFIMRTGTGASFQRQSSKQGPGSRHLPGPYPTLCDETRFPRHPTLSRHQAMLRVHPASSSRDLLPRKRSFLLLIDLGTCNVPAGSAAGSETLFSLLEVQYHTHTMITGTRHSTTSHCSRGVVQQSPSSLVGAKCPS